MTDKAKKYFLLTSLLLGAAFLVLSLWVHQDVFRDIDFEILNNMQNAINRKVDIPFSYLTIFGSSEVISIIVGVIFLASLYIGRHLFLSIFLYLLIFLLEFLGKLFIFHPDPPSMYNRYALGLHLPSSFIINTNFSYPSGHVARTTFLTVVLLFFILRWRTDRFKKIILTVSLLVLLSAVLVSRIYLGEHWLSDVIGGFILGSSISSLAIVFW